MPHIEKVTCDTCGGDGKTYYHETCPKCDGTGMVDGLFGPKVCGQCAGTRQATYEQRCSSCNGRGWVHQLED